MSYDIKHRAPRSMSGTSRCPVRRAGRRAASAVAARQSTPRGGDAACDSLDVSAEVASSASCFASSHSSSPPLPCFRSVVASRVQLKRRDPCAARAIYQQDMPRHAMAAWHGMVDHVTCRAVTWHDASPAWSREARSRALGSERRSRGSLAAAPAEWNGVERNGTK